MTGTAIYKNRENGVENRFKRNTRFGLGYVKLKMPITHPSGDFKRTPSLGFGEVKAGNNL